MKTSHVIVAGLLASCVAVRAQYTNKSSVLDGSGTLATGGSYTNISAAGQPGGIAVSSGGSYVNQAGFLNTFFLRPALDVDGDGLANEADLDNDNDGLADTAEIGGLAFSPATTTGVNVADTDGDGMSDGQESTAGTDPTNPAALLEMVRIGTGAVVQVGWRARSNKTYAVRYAASPLQPVTNLLGLATATGFADPPWYVLTNAVSDPASATGRVYAVEAIP